jgi:hypothetical protein
VVKVPGEGNVPAILPAETYPRYLYHAHYSVGNEVRRVQYEAQQLLLVAYIDVAILQQAEGLSLP